MVTQWLELPSRAELVETSDCAKMYTAAVDDRASTPPANKKYLQHMINLNKIKMSRTLLKSNCKFGYYLDITTSNKTIKLIIIAKTLTNRNTKTTTEKPDIKKSY